MRIRTWLALVVMVVISSSAGVAQAQDDACFEKNGFWDAEQQRCVIKTGLEINIKYPLELIQYPLVEQTVDDFLANTRGEFISEFLGYGVIMWSPGPWGLYIDYEIFQFSPMMLSLKFTVSNYTGGAHGNSYFQTYLFDLEHERLLTLEDIFAPGTDIVSLLAPIVRQDLAAQQGEYADIQWIQDGTSSLEAYMNFVITPETLFFFFPPYQVAAYAVGALTVPIPLSQISGTLMPPFNGMAN